MIAIIPAHGFSRRVERKHTRPFAGKSLTQWSVIQAKYSHCIDDVYVSTNDIEVSNQVMDVGGKVIWREYDEHPDDGAGKPIFHALYAIDEPAWPVHCGLLVTSPIRPPGMIDRLYNEWIAQNKPWIMHTSGVQEETCVYMRTQYGSINVFMDKRGPFTGYQHSTYIVSTEEYIQTFERTLELGRDHDAVGEAAKFNDIKPEEVKPYPYIDVPWWHCVEPDTPEDFPICEVLFKHMLNGRGEDAYQEYYEETK